MCVCVWSWGNFSEKGSEGKGEIVHAPACLAGCLQEANGTF